jgi:hypothetical protein
MKSYGTYKPPETVGIEFQRLAIPRGNELPRAPVAGELFYLETEMQDKNMRPSFFRGLYMSTGFGWSSIGEQIAKRRSAPIGAQIFEVEVPAVVKDTPTSNDGFHLATVSLTPSNKRTQVSGTASFWASTDRDGYVLVSVFRGKKLVGLTVDFLFAGKPGTVSLSFMDSPASHEEQTYSLRVTTTATGFLYVNQSKLFDYDGLSQTAFIVYENN